MRKRSKLLLTTIGATLVITISWYTASANNRSVNEINFKDSTIYVFNDADGVIRCPVTLGGSYHSSTIHKTLGALIGYVNAGAITGSCTGGTATLNRETLPWHEEFSGFAGTLPTPQSWWEELIDWFFRARSSSGIECSARSTTAHPVRSTFNVNASGQVTSVDTSGSIPLSGGFLCSLAGNGELTGRGTFTTPAGGTATWRLI